MTRAWCNVISLDFQKAFYYHPLWFVPLIMVFLFYYLKRRSQETYNFMLVLFATLFIIVYLIRLVCGSEVVMPVFKNGLLYRCFIELLHL